MNNLVIENQIHTLVTFGEAFKIDGLGKVKLSDLDFTLLAGQFDNIKRYFEIGYITFRKDEHTTASFEEFEKIAKEHGFYPKDLLTVNDKSFTEDEIDNIKKKLLESNSSYQIVSIDEVEKKATNEEIEKLNLQINEQNQYIISLQKLVSNELESDVVDEEDLKNYCTLNDIDFGKKTTKKAILEVINKIESER